MKLEQSHATPGVPGDATLIALERQQRANIRTRWAVVGALALGAVVSLSVWLARSGDAPPMDVALSAAADAVEPEPAPAATAPKAAEAAAAPAAPPSRADEQVAAAVTPPAPPTTAEPAAAATEPAAAQPQPAVASTGSFDVIVAPAGASVVLDGQDLGIAPLRVSNVLVGAHRLEVIGPEGFQSYREDIQLPADERQVFELELEPEPEPEPEAALVAASAEGDDDLDETLVEFTSEPVGADVVVIADGQSMHLGPTPVSVRLNRASDYYAVFTKDGYGVETRSVDLDGEQAKVVAELRSKAPGAGEAGDKQLDDVEKALLAAASREARNAEAPPRADEASATADSARRKRSRARRARSRRARQRPAAVSARTAPDIARKARPRGNTGTLMLGAKPPCQIFVDGKSTGLLTPQRALPLAPGRHRIKLVNREHGIKTSFTVVIKAGRTTRVIRDLTSRM